MKNLYLLICLQFIFSHDIQAQNWWDWSYQMTESEGTPPALDVQNNIIRIGVTPWGCNITKYNRQGHRLWQKPYQGRSSAIVADEHGNIYAAGPVTDSGLHTANYTGNIEPQFNRTFKVPHTFTKFSPDGLPQWSLYSSKDISTIHVSANGDLYVAGTFYSSSNQGVFYDSILLGNMGILPFRGCYNIFVGKIDRNGTPVWLKTFKKSNPADPYDSFTPANGAIISDNFGNIYLTGTNTSGNVYADTIPLFASYSSDFIMQLNAETGALKWARIIRYSDYTRHSYPMASGKAQYAVLNGDGSNGVLMAGSNSTPYNIIFGDSVYRSTGKYICAYDTSGREKWMKPYNIGEGKWPAGFYKKGNKFYIGHCSSYSGNQDTIAVMDSTFNIIKKISTPGIWQFTVQDQDESIIAVRKSFISNENLHLCKVLPDRNKVTGYIFSDDNSNGIKDSAEAGFANVLVGASGNRFITLTDKNGYYECYVDSGNHTIVPVTGVKYHTYAPAAGYAVQFTGYGNITAAKNFACSPIPGIHDLQVTITPTGRVRPGMITYYTTTVKNNGTEIATGTASVKLPAYTGYVADSSLSLPVFSSADSIVFAFNGLLPGEEKRFTFKSHLSTLLTWGEIITVYSSVLPVMTDTVPGDNYDTLTQRVTGSFDPNDKLVFPGSDLNITQKDKPLHYTIRFQNTGNDTAFTVHLIDTLSAKLDITTLEMMSSSHNYTAKIENGNILHFYFDSINLVDSFHNEPLSHGYIRFKIKPASSVTIGDNILNNAAIYFDYNKAVITNTTSTRYTSVVLPVVLTSFTAVKNNYTADITFSTETELSLRHFEIERSNDGYVFTKLKAVEAKGESSIYNYTDTRPMDGINYYRIKLLFADGSVAYSYVQAVQMKQVKKTLVFPNPANGTLYFTATLTGELTYKIYSTEGKLFYSGYNNNIQAGNITSVNTASLLPGLYYIEITNKEKRETVKFFVQHDR